MTLEPFGHALGLFLSLGRETPAEVRLAGLRFAMTPQDEVHAPLRFRVASCA
jgi:hypothetical protein